MVNGAIEVATLAKTKCTIYYSAENYSKNAKLVYVNYKL